MNTYYKNIIFKLLERNYTISIAESCTGGNICQEFTKIPGISKSLICGVIAYSNIAKINFLNINKSNLKKYGSVSKEIAKEMALNLMNKSNSDYCISTTGIAGPSGKTKNKPVGLVYIAIAYNKKVYLYKRNFKGSRINIQKKITKAAFEILDKNIKH